MAQYFLRKVNENDRDDIFLLSNEDYVRKYSINKEPITWEEHILWFDTVMMDDSYVFYVVIDEKGKFSGQIRYKVYEEDAVVSISLSKSVLGKGLSIKLLIESIKRVISEKNIRYIVAYVNEKNIPSKKLFIRAGFILMRGMGEGSMEKYIYSVSGSKYINIY